jgi:hypothetical protein
MKYVYGILIVTLCTAAYAKDLGGLYCILPGKYMHTADYNILVNHTQELERKVGGMQKCITELYTRVIKLEKR